MDNIDFPIFLATRYRCCVHASFSADVLNQYPNAPEVLFNSWYDLESKNTCPYKFRLDFDDPVLETSYVTTQINYLAHQIADPSAPTPKPDLPWFKYWAELAFTREKAPDYLFTDVPICYIFVSTTPGSFSPPHPHWMDDFIKDIPVFNLVISPSSTQQTRGNYFIAREVSEKAFFDFVLKITHYEAAPRLTSLRETTKLFVNNNWGGIKNSVLRLFGFSGGNRNRAEIVIKLKQLGDICFGCGDFQSAFNYYQQLYQELSDEDPPVGDSLFIMFAISSIILNSDIDVEALLAPILTEKRASLMAQIQCSFLTLYFSTKNNRVPKTVYLYKLTHRLIKDSSLPFAFISFPMLFEAMATILPRRSAAYYMIRVSFDYKRVGLMRNYIILLWRVYHMIHLTGWPKLEHSILLRISAFGEAPPQLHNLLVQRNMSFISQTVEELKKLKMKDFVFIESIIIHEMIVPPTGYPHSPPPGAYGRSSWAAIRKRLFPVVYHPSTEEFATTVWTAETKSSHDYTTGVGEEHFISFKMTPLLPEGCQMHNLQLYVEPDDAVDNEIVQFFDLKTTTKMKMAFSPRRVCSYLIKGIKFMWFGAAPVAALFSDALRFDAQDHSPDASLEIINAPEIAYLNLPVVFGAKAKMLTSEITTLHVVADSSSANVTLRKPNCQGFLQRWSLDPSIKEQELVFEAMPSLAGLVRFDIFLSFTNNYHVTRFCHVSHTVDCKEVHKFKIFQQNEFINLQPENDISRIECDCAQISTNGGCITIRGANPKFAGERCTIKVRRNFTGTVMDDVLNINDIFLKFKETDFKLNTENPIIKFSFEAICLGQNEGNIVLLDPADGSFRWCGKIKYNLKGPGKRIINVSLLAFKSFEMELGDVMKVEYGKTQLKVTQIVLVD